MITTHWRELNLSRLMLGTVQFGMPYGIANVTGQPDHATVRAMLATAVDGGINCFDTAASYGTSEEVLGSALHELGLAKRVTVVTKVRPLSAMELNDPGLAEQAIRQSVAESRRRLRLDCLPVVLFHREPDAVFQWVLEDLQKEGWLRYAGVSCDNRPGAAAEFAASGQFDALQLPGNLLDRRHQSSGVFQQSLSRGVAVFIRSVYLQGLLLMSEESIPPALREVIPVRQRLINIANAAGMDLAELGLRYMLSQAGVTCVLTGAESVAQVQANLTMCRRGVLESDVQAAVDATAVDLREQIVTPALWPPPATADAGLRSAATPASPGPMAGPENS